MYADGGYVSVYAAHPLFLVMTSQREISIGVTARDEYNNLMNVSKTISITFDNTPPVPAKIYSNWPGLEGEYFVREDNNTISMSIVETGSGMGNRFVTMDFSNFGAQSGVAPAYAEGSSIFGDDVSDNVPGTSSTNLRANDCVPGWTCNWRWVTADLPYSGNTVSLKPAYGTQDDAGNLMEQEISGVFIVDKDGPIVPDDYDYPAERWR